MAAQVWGVPIARRIGEPMPDCSRCRDPGSEELRKVWGCDAPSHGVVFQTTCSRCNGAGCPPALDRPWPHPTCIKGARVYYRCMSHEIARHRGRGVENFLHAYQLFDAHGVMPATGSWLDQTCHFEIASRVIASERAAWDREEEEHRRQSNG